MNRLFLIGFMGCGKSAAGRRLATLLGWQWIDLDRFLESRYRKSTSQLFTDLGEAAFRQLERRALEEVAQYEHSVISTGGGTPCFGDNMALIKASGTSVYLYCDAPTLALRLASSHNQRPLLAAYQGDALIERINDLLHIRRPYYEQADFRVSSAAGNFKYIDTIYTKISAEK